MYFPGGIKEKLDGCVGTYDIPDKSGGLRCTCNHCRNHTGPSRPSTACCSGNIIGTIRYQTKTHCIMVEFKVSPCGKSRYCGPPYHSEQEQP